MDTNQKISQSLKVYWQSAMERREQLSNKMKGGANPAKLIIIRKKISQSKIGKHFKHQHPISLKQKTHLQKLADLRKGKRLSLETRIKISKSRKGKCRGKDNPFYGRHHTVGSIRKIKEKHSLSRSARLQDIISKAEGLGFKIKAYLNHDFKETGLRKYAVLDPLGYIIGTIPTDAYFDKPPKKDHYIYSISAKDKDFIAGVAACFKNKYDIHLNLGRQRTLFRIQTRKKQIEELLNFVKKENGSQWIFNERVFGSSHNFYRSVLIAVCDAEGCVTNAVSENSIISRHITVTNSSVTLLRQIKVLLELFGISSYIYRHRGPRLTQIRGESCDFKKEVFTLIITGRQNLLNFKESIGFLIKRKQKKLESILNSYKKFDRPYSQNEYSLIMQLSKYFSNSCDISRLTGIPPHTVRNWILYHRLPRSIKMTGAL